MEQRQRFLDDIRKLKLAPQAEMNDAEIQQLEAEADKLQKQAAQTLKDGFSVYN